MAPDTDAIKTALAARITARIREMGIKQVEAAELLCVDPPRVSAIVNGDLGQFGVYRLMRYVAGLGDDLAIVVRAGARGRLFVTAAAPPHQEAPPPEARRSGRSRESRGMGRK